MDFEILYPGPFATLQVSMDKGETFKAESGAMITMSDTIDMKSKLEGGILGGLTRKLLTGESLFFQSMTASRGEGTVLLASPFPSEITVLELDGNTEYIVQKDGFLAADDTISLSTKAQNLAKGFLSGEGFFILRAGGKGKLALTSYGAIHKFSLAPNETRIVDNGHMVAWSSNMKYKIEKASKGWISSFTSGEALVCRFIGPGDVFIQTRNSKGFGFWLNQFLSGKK